MPDIIQNGADGIKRRYVDSGDGTFAERVSVSGGGGGGGGASGDVTAAGTSGTVAQAVQGITGGVPMPVSSSALTSIDNKTPTLQGGAVPVTARNISTKFREAFEAYTAGVNWTEVKATGDLIYADGNAAGASYLVISKNPLLADTESSIASIAAFSMPIELAVGLSMSQRTLGQEFSLEIVDTGAQIADTADVTIDTIQQVTTTLTVTTSAPHGLSVGRTIGIRALLDSRLNYPALVVGTVTSPTQFTTTAGPGGALPSLSAYTTTVLAATTAALPTNAYANGASGVGATLTASANGAFPDQDGVAIPLGGRVLVKNEAAGANNGVYTLTQVGSAGAPWILTRATDLDTAAELTVVANALFAVSVFVAGGATQAQKEFYLSATVTTVGTTAVTWVDSGAPAAPMGYVFIRQRMSRARNGASQIFESTSTTNASLYIRSEAGDALPSGVVAGNHGVLIGTTQSVQLAGAVPYTYSFSPTTEFRIFQQADRTQWADSAVDAVAQTTSRLLRTQVCPDLSETYRLRVRANNAKSLTVPNAQIVSAVKSGTTTATITTAIAHGLLPGDLVLVYGVRDQAAASFPNLVTATPVASVPSSTSFTIVIGTASTVTSYGGFVARVQGGNLLSALGAPNVAVQTAALTTLADGTRQLTVAGSATWVGSAVIGDLVDLVGVRDNTAGATLGVDGPWKVANIVTTTLTLVLPFSGQRALPADFGTVAVPTNCGGGLIRRTDIRLSFVRVFDYERQRVEMLARPLNDMSAAAPVVLQGGTLPTVTTVTGVTTVSTVTTVTGVTTVSAVTAANLGIPGIIADVASAALTTTTTTAAFTPTFGTAYSVNIPVTAVTGTTPTLDISIEESDDTGTNWFKVYDFPRITATGMYRSPIIRMTGNRVRYVQTVGGTTPSFTRAINRLQCSTNSEPVRQLIDRTVVLTTLNSTTPSLDARDAGNRIQLVVNVGAITTTAPQLQLEGSDDNGASWYSIGTPLTAVASSTVQVTIADINAALVRARVSTAGVGVTAGYVMVKAHD